MNKMPLLTTFLHGAPVGVAALAAVVMGVTAGTQFLEDSTVKIPTVASVGAVVVMGAWQLSRRFQRLDDRLEKIDRARDVVQEALARFQRLDERLEKIDHRFESLACQMVKIQESKAHVCPEPGKGEPPVPG